MDFLNNIQAFLVEKLGPAGPLLAVGALGFLLVLLTLPAILKAKPEPFDKLKNQTRGATTPQGQTLRNGSKKVDKLEKFAGFLEPQSAEELSASRLKMLRAGYRSKDAVRIFHFAQLVLGIGLLSVGTIYALVLSHTSGTSLTMQQMVMYTVLPGAVGYYGPRWWVERRLQERQTQITQGFPDALDMMLVCVEAGQSLDQTISRVARESRAGYPALADELEMVSHEVKAGKERVQVLKDMAERVGLPDVTSFVTTLIQSATFGTSIAEALRVYSSEMRDKRVMRAEEQANKLPTKLTLGTMMFTVPPLMIILVGPSVYGIATSMGGG